MGADRVAFKLVSWHSHIRCVSRDWISRLSNLQPSWVIWSLLSTPLPTRQSYVLVYPWPCCFNYSSYLNLTVLRQLIRLSSLPSDTSHFPPFRYRRIPTGTVCDSHLRARSAVAAKLQFYSLIRSDSAAGPYVEEEKRP
jgi:hypothetical protein